LRKWIALVVAAAGLALAAAPGMAAESGPAGRSGLRDFTPSGSESVAPGTVGVRSSVVYEYKSGELEIMGEVWNRTTTRKANINVYVTWLDSAGDPIGSASEFAVLRELASGNVNPFRIFDADPPAGIDAYTIEAQPSSFRPSAADGVLEVVVTDVTEDTGTLVFDGHVVNHASFAVEARTTPAALSSR
jgi:hypothetical protein